jgi:hypothetical protein
MTPAKAIPELLRWFTQHRLDHGVRFYMQDEWRRRKERYGNDADFTMTAEGDFNHLYNYPQSTEDDAIIREFQKTVSRLGYHVEQGYAWSWHFHHVGATVTKINPLWAGLARRANEVARLSWKKGAPKLTANSSRETLLAWMAWNDPNSFWDEDPDLSMGDLWEGIAQYIEDS